MRHIRGKTMTTWLECHECNEMFSVKAKFCLRMPSKTLRTCHLLQVLAFTARFPMLSLKRCTTGAKNPATLFSVSIAQRILNGETQFQRWTEKRKPIREMTMHLMQLKNDLYKNHWRERRNWKGVSVRKLAAHYHCSEDQTRQAMLELQEEYPAPKRNK